MFTVQQEKQLAVQARKELPPPPLVARQEKIITQPIDDNDNENMDVSVKQWAYVYFW